MKIFIHTSSSRFQFLLIWIALVILSVGCSKDDPKKEDTPELITKATLTFTPTGGGTAVVVSATDPDGEGVQNIAVDGAIDLVMGTQYVLTIDLLNTLVTAGQPGYSITEEVEEEGDEHMIFFSWTGDVFQVPSGNGNIDNRGDAVDYVDLDGNSRPVGLITTWTASSSVAAGTFRVLLKHQPDLKTDTSGSAVGETDLDLTFTINVN
ncbi:MAG: hypothetical protein JNK10_07105 [Cyclobacteriaceae bacterium]|nr:hypothetical protein [Cyclobacteriaceae bacterium]